MAFVGGERVRVGGRGREEWEKKLEVSSSYELELEGESGSCSV